MDSPSSATEDSTQDGIETIISQESLQSLSQPFSPSPCSSRNSIPSTTLSNRPGTPYPYIIQAGSKNTFVHHNRPKTPVGPPINTRVQTPQYEEPSHNSLDLENIEQHLVQAEADLQQIFTSHTLPSASSNSVTQPSTSSASLAKPSTRLPQQPSTSSTRVTQQPHTHTRKKQKKDDKDTDEMFTEISTRLLDRLEKKGSNELKYGSYGKHVAQQLGILDDDIADDIIQIIDTALYNGKKHQRVKNSSHNNM